MKRRLPVPAPAVGIVALTLAIAVALVVESAARGNAFDPAGIGIITFFAFPAMGLLILRHHPRHIIGWLLLLIGLNVYLIFGGADYAAVALLHYQALLVFGNVVAWISGWLWIPFILMVVLFTPMLFPDGRLLSRRWLVVVLSGFIFAALALAGNAFNPGPIGGSDPVLQNPLGFPGLQPLFRTLVSLSLPFGAVMIFGSLASVIVRYRRGDGLQRRQLRWFLVAMGAAIIPFLLQGNLPDAIVTTFLVLLVPLLPISIAIAVLRYRLYDIDVVINRALVYGVLAAFITAVYVGIVVGIGALLGAGNRPNIVLSIAATAVVAVAFQPVRERLQQFANRVVYGERATPYEVMAGFADRMAGTLSGDEVLPRMAEAAARGVGAQAARVALLLPDGSRRTTDWPETASGWLFPPALPISHQGETIGEIAVRKGPGEPITPGEQRLLADLAAQAGLVLHNVRLTAELEARLNDLSAQATDLRASRQRIVAARETERRRLEGEIRVGVRQDLEAMSPRLDEVDRLLHQDDSRQATQRLEELVTETQQTLDGLRELARGIFPPLLADKGIVSALEAHSRKTAVSAAIEVTADLAGRRFDPGVEAAVYFCCIEALRGVSAAPTIRLSAGNGVLAFSIDGTGALNGRLQALRDRLEAVGGHLEEPVPGCLEGRVPLQPVVSVA
ncbi:MAG: hypothetical protein ABI401_13240 [Candidatus Dormibacter sp.]